ncbi:uncharacterized protein RJT20DRAFT_24268 [Scheffersomyces xylosifermentans]|uniref:uncharacterized protein n=1 Tax=Scheffersomyces xylosifermentans TaxID=1304137 RepID=UPI00315D921E
MAGKFFNPETATYLDPTKDRRVVYLTGGHSGIGWFTALHLYLHGYVVYLAGRTESKVTSAIEKIKAEAEKRVKESKDKEVAQHFGELHFSYIDLLDLSTVSAAAQKFLKSESKLHILINNAGLMAVPFEETKDGFEIQYQVNFVSHFLLTLLLLPALDAVAKEGKVEPRVVNLSSFGHNFMYKDFKPEDPINKAPNYVYSWVRYGKAKAAQIQISQELAKRHPEILSLSVHPGFIMSTGLYTPSKSMFGVGLFSGVVKPLVNTSEEDGATASLRAALDTTLTAKKDSGKYLVTGGAFGTPTKLARSVAGSKATWDWTYDQLQKKGFAVEA